MFNNIVKEKWSHFLNIESKKEYFLNLKNKIDNESQKEAFLPENKDVFKVLEKLSLEDIKVVILGQDPYPTPGVANGLAFAVNLDCKTPGSLNNIFREIQYEYGEINTQKDLISWVEQGVFLLNTILTVKKHAPLACKNWGWEKFTFNLLKYILDNKQHVVIVCFGKYAQNFVQTLQSPNHLFLMCTHPSPLSAYNGFFGCNVFKKTNEYLLKHHQIMIKW